MTPVTLRVVAGEFVVWRLPPTAPVPDLGSAPIVSLTRTAAEISGISPRGGAPRGATQEPGWACLEVEGPLPFELTGVVASLSSPLAAAGVPIFVTSTFDTDYLLVRTADLEKAVETLEAAGHSVSIEAASPDL